MNEAPLDELYFKWLYVQVASARLTNPARSYWKLLLKLYTTEFKWWIPNDDNRVIDGVLLRHEFLDANPNASADLAWLNEGVSFFEMLIALSRRLSFADSRASSQVWFWHLMENVDLVIPDSEFDTGDRHEHVDEVLERLNKRTYEFDGRGGLFPLRNTDIDQRRVELWYQMNYYLLERG